MKARNVVIALVVALSLIIGYIPIYSFAATYEDFDGNDSLNFKVDPPKSTTVYFNEDGQKVSGPTDYWIKFELSEDKMYLSYTSNNVIIDELSVKGGNGYRLYTGLGSSGSDFRAPDNDGGQIPVISHYSFNITIKPPPPPPPPKGELDITKIVKDHNGDVLSEDDTVFKFRLYMLVDDEWEEVVEESPFYITGNDTVTIDELELGKYKVVEVDIPEGFDLDSANDIEVTLDKNSLEKKVDFTNKKDPPPPEYNGEIEVTKYLFDEEENPITDDDTEFTFVLYKLDGEDWVEVDSLSIKANESASFTNLAPGEYKVVEEDIPQGYYLVSVNDQEVTIIYDDQVESLEFNNVKDSWEGFIRVQKLFREDPNANVEGFTFVLMMDNEVVAGPIATDEDGIAEFGPLPAGTYTIVETTPGYIAEYLDDNPVTIGPEEGNENDNIWVVRVNNNELPPPEKGRIEVEKIVQTNAGNLIIGNTTIFYFELDMRVEGEWVTIDEGFIVGNGKLIFDNLDVGEYRIREVDIDDDFDLFSNNNLVVEIIEGSDVGVDFINRLIPPPPPPPPPPEDEPEPEPEVVFEEPIPEAPPEVLEEVEVVEEPVPQAVLPKTGPANPFALSGFGGLLAGLGLLLKKKKEEE